MLPSVYPCRGVSVAPYMRRGLSDKKTEGVRCGDENGSPLGSC